MMNFNNFVLISILIPCYNEERYILRCLNSIFRQDYAKDKLEVLVIDGMSKDETIQKIKDFLSQSRESGTLLESNNQKKTNWKKEKNNSLNVRIIENPKRTVPSGLNMGVKEASGNYIIRMDAHTEYSKDYVSKCIEWLGRKGMENVGGPMCARGDGLIGKAVELAHHSFFGLGGGKFHDDNYSGYVDTVYLGAWPKRVFEEVGLFDERLIRNQDIEFNTRIRKTGGKIYLTPEIKSYYYCREDLKGLWKQNFENGKWVIFTKAIAPYCLSWRHFIPLLFVVSLIVSGLMLFVCNQFDVNKLSALCSLLFVVIIVSYVFANLFFSIMLSFKRGFKYIFILPIVFATLHFSYGLGSICGLIKLRSWFKYNKSTKKIFRYNDK